MSAAARQPMENGAQAMPEPRRELLTSEIVREYMEENRRGTEAVLRLENRLESFVERVEESVNRLDTELSSLTTTLRGDGQQLGLMSKQALIEQRLQAVERGLEGINAEGTPASRGQFGVLTQQMAQTRQEVEELKLRQKEGVGRGWQIALAVLTPLLSAALAFLVAKLSR